MGFNAMKKQIYVFYFNFKETTINTRQRSKEQDAGF